MAISKMEYQSKQFEPARGSPEPTIAEGDNQNANMSNKKKKESRLPNFETTQKNMFESSGMVNLKE